MSKKYKIMDLIVVEMAGMREEVGESESMSCEWLKDVVVTQHQQLSPKGS